MRLCGFLNIHKPKGVTSRAVVDQVGRRLRRIKLGHCGTLDPLASGVLVLAVGRAARIIEQIHELPKTYRSHFCLGATSATDDAEGPITSISTPHAPSLADVEAGLKRFVGVFAQIPPRLSAVKLAGTRAHELARKGLCVDLPARQVMVQRISLLTYAYPRLEIEVECGKGTYIRSLARDLGEALGCGGYVGELIRTRIGPFHLKDAIPWGASKEALLQNLCPLTQGLTHLPRLEALAEDFERLRHGRCVVAKQLDDTSAATTMGWLAHGLDDVVILVRIDARQRLLIPIKIIVY